jgi:hypothetical protein
MKSPIAFGLATLIGGAALANTSATTQLGKTSNEASKAKETTVELTLQLTPEQQEELARVLDQLKIEVKNWEMIADKELPSRCC